MGQHPPASDSELPPEDRAFRRDRQIFRGDLIGDGGRGKTQYNLGSDALPHAKDAEDQGAFRRDSAGSSGGFQSPDAVGGHPVPAEFHPGSAAAPTPTEYMRDWLRLRAYCDMAIVGQALGQLQSSTDSKNALMNIAPTCGTMLLPNPRIRPTLSGTP